MSNKTLFALIKTMSRAEKGHFKKYSRAFCRKNEANYLRLFDAMEKMDAYDEPAIRSTFRNEKFLTQLPVAKNYLYHSLLKSLESYYHAAGIDAWLESSLQRIRILLRKGLHRQGNALIASALRTAEHHEKHWHLAEFLRMENEVQRIMGYGTGRQKKGERFFQNIYDNLELYKNTVQYQHMAFRIQTQLALSGFSRTGDDRGPGLTGSMQVLFRRKSMASCFLARYYLLHCHMLGMLMRNDYRKAAGYAKQMCLLFEASTHQLAERPRQYIIALEYYIICIKRLGNYGEMVPVLEKLKKIRDIIYKNRALHDEVLYLHAHQELSYHLAIGDIGQAMHCAGEIARELREGRTPVINRQLEMILYYTLAHVHFIAGLHETALVYLNKILNEFRIDLRNDVQCFARILNLLVHFELGNNILMEHEIKSVYRFLLKRDHLYRIETVILRFLRKVILDNTSSGEIPVLLQVLKHELKTVAKNPSEEQAIRYFDFISWLESKISGVPFAEIVRKKAMTTANIKSGK